MKKYNYDIECEDCQGEGRYDLTVNGNESVGTRCDDCSGTTKTEINPFVHFEEKLIDAGAALNDIVYDMKTYHKLDDSDIKKFLNGWLKEFKKEI